ncbi:hypothetical protein ISCGN_012933 [Ixodes scapularis]
MQGGECPPSKTEKDPKHEETREPRRCLGFPTALFPVLSRFSRPRPPCKGRTCVRAQSGFIAVLPRMSHASSVNQSAGCDFGDEESLGAEESRCFFPKRKPFHTARTRHRQQRDHEGKGNIATSSSKQSSRRAA